ncbi:hemolysin family protein [Verrucomicrobiota bacterium]
MTAVILLVIIVCMAGSAFFAGIETGVISVHPLRFQHALRKGSRRARILQKFIEHSDRLLGTTLVGNNLCLVVISVLSASFAVSLFGVWGQAVSTVLVSVLVLIFCEYIPKAWFYARPLERCIRYAHILRISEMILRPLATGIVGLIRLLTPGTSRSFFRPISFVTRDDLKTLAAEGEKHGVLSRQERVMIHRVIELSGKKACQIMIPRHQATIINSDTSIRDFLETVKATGFTRFPVCDNESGEFTGIVNVFSALSLRDADISKQVADIMKYPLFIPEDMPVDEIFPRLRRSRQPMCLVINKKSEVVGLITTEDILEEVVGKL